MSPNLKDELTAKIKVLHDTVWEHRGGTLAVEGWLANFNRGDEIERQQLHALYLLSHFIYFGNRQIRALLKAMFRDLFKYPIVEHIRRTNAHTTDISFIEQRFLETLRKTRFLGIGNPSESGSHLLYYYRQENVLPKEAFIHTHQIFRGRGSTMTLRDSDVDQFVFIDDFCGSGQQGKEYSEDILQDLKHVAPGARTLYHVLFATSKGIETLRKETLFDSVDCIYELDDSFKCFSDSSRFFTQPPPGLDKSFSESMCRIYGEYLSPSCPLGYGDCQLLIGFHHNTPDNTLPIIWYDEPGGVPWTPIFKRYPKFG